MSALLGALTIFEISLKIFQIRDAFHCNKQNHY